MAEIVEHITDARSDGTINVYAVRYNQRGRSDNVAIALPGNPSFDFRHDFCENIICYPGLNGSRIMRRSMTIGEKSC